MCVQWITNKTITLLFQYFEGTVYSELYAEKQNILFPCSLIPRLEFFLYIFAYSYLNTNYFFKKPMTCIYSEPICVHLNGTRIMEPKCEILNI